MNDQEKPQGTTEAPPRLMHPYLVLVIAILFPGVGQVMNNMTLRGLAMISFMVLLGWVTYYTTTPEHSYLGRYAGGFFVYAISIVDAYRWARYRWVFFGKQKLPNKP